jgi:hypothetical protein
MVTPAPRSVLSSASLVGASHDDVAYFSNTAKDARERWVFERWCSLTGRNAACAIKGERPDFTLNGEGIEVTEVMEPGRRRHREYKDSLRELVANPQSIPIHDSLGLETILHFSQQWILDRIIAKANHYGAPARDWSLVIYANYSFVDRTNWSAVRASLISGPRVFNRIEALLADGQSQITLYP